MVFVGVVVGAVINEFGTVTDHFTELALAALTLNVAAMAISFSIARLARLDERQSTAIAMELGVHNAALAIAVGTSIDDLLRDPGGRHSVFQLFTAGAFARLMHRRNTGGADDSLAAGAHAPVS